MVARIGFLCMLVVQVLGVLLLALPAFADRAISLGLPPQFWALGMSVGRSNSLYVSEGSPYSASWDFAVAPTIILNRDYTLGALVEYSQDLREEDLDFGRGSISLRKASGTSAFAKRVKFTPTLTAGFPISRAAQASSLQASLGSSARMDVNPDYLFSKRWSIAATLGLTRNFHQYDTAYKGTVNTQWSSTQSLETGWAFTDWMGLNLTLGHIDTLSYQGVAKDYIFHSQELDFKLSPRWSASVGHSWGKPYVSTRKFDGQSLNLELADEDNSLVFTNLTFLL
jgi:hypothetical protein